MIRSSHWKFWLVLFPIIGTCALANFQGPGGMKGFFSQWYSINIFPRSGLLAEYKFDTNANDTSGNSFDAILTNGASVSSGVLVLDGVDDGAELPEINTPTNSISVSVWYFANDHDSTYGDGIIGDWTFSANTNSAIGIAIDPPNRSTSFFIVAGNTFYRSATFNGSTGIWTHVVGVFNGTNILFYKDSVVQGLPVSAPYVNNMANGFNGVIGDYQFLPSSQRFNGKIDNVRIYNRALSGSEINSLYLEGYSQ